MLRSILLGGALAAAAAVPSPAHADGTMYHLCYKVVVSGVVNQTVAPRCIDWPYSGVNCPVTGANALPLVAVEVDYCVPTPLA